MRNQLNAMLESLNRELIEMASLCETAIDRAMQAFAGRDAGLAQSVVHGDLQINEKERIIEALCLSIILHQQPIAHDLRMVSAALKMITDLERIGDHASDIAAMVTTLKFQHFSAEHAQIQAMAGEAAAMLRQVIGAFIAGDPEAARQTFANDDIIDARFTDIKQSLIMHIKAGDEADDALDLFMISKYLERIGDHACSIAGRVLCALESSAAA